MYTAMAKDWRVSVGQGWKRSQRAMAYGRKVDREIQQFHTKDCQYEKLGEGARAVVDKIREKGWQIVNCQYKVSNESSLARAAAQEANEAKIQAQAAKRGKNGNAIEGTKPVTVAKIQPQASKRAKGRKIATPIDIICKDTAGVYVILELKSTTQPLGRYRKWYNVPDPEFPKMIDGLPNSSYWRHQKQLWANMRLWTLQEGTNKMIKGFVVLACRGTALLLPLDMSFVQKPGE